jgi:hypothetical protein
MRWSDIITLITLIPPITDETTPGGFDTPPAEIPRVVFGNKKAAWQSDFYQGMQVGINAQFRFTLWKADYNNEELAEYDGKRYRIVKADDGSFAARKTGEYVELVLSDLSERSEI